MNNTVKIIVDGTEQSVPAGISVAAAVLGHNHNSNDSFFHNSMDGSPRSPYCLMGVCFECMLEINGEENVQSCLVEVKENMIINRQKNDKPFSFDNDEGAQND